MELEQRRTKIVCTLGPATASEKWIKRLIEAGMNVARINFSHGEKDILVDYIKKVRACEEATGKPIAILEDLKGPKIRVGQIEGHRIDFFKGDELDIVYGDILGSKERISINQKELFSDVKVGDRLLVDDGKVTLKIKDLKEGLMHCVVVNDGTISSRKGINAPGVVLTMPFVSEKDYQDVLTGIEQKVNYIAASFVRRAQDVLDIRKILNDNGGSDIGIIAKIENQEGIDNIEEIAKVANGIMVARGDMGVEIPLEMVPVYQKKIIQLCNKLGKPVITATHMLESMTHCLRPTRAEASDVANAVLDGTDAVMTSGETAVGEYPIETVETMASIIREIEKTVDYRSKYENLSLYGDLKINDAIGVSISSCAISLNSKAIFAFTESGGTAIRISRFRPAKPIIACTDSLRSAERLALYWGVSSVIVRRIKEFLEYDQIGREVSRQLGFEEGDVVIMTSGYGVEHGQTNTIRLLTI